ncbi:MAG: hypothetical protein MUD01_19030 [Chloroflexaceae bacterium]|nr:hypothetical protein [Chloroflexaceae bacterium]
MTTYTLTPTPPFDFGQSLAFLGMFPPTKGEQQLQSASLTKAVMIGGQPLVFRVTSTGSMMEPCLAYTLHTDGPITPALRIAAEDRIRFFLSLDDDLRPFYSLAEADAPFWPVVQRLYGLHQVKFLTPFEHACWAVLTQRNPMAQASKTKAALTTRYGDSLTLDGVAYHAFPEAARLAAASEAELCELVRHEKRATYLHAVAVAFAGADEDWMRTAPYGEVEAWLRSIKGIGAWSAAFVLLRGLGRTERLPIGEERLAEAAERVYGRKLNPLELTRIANGYGPYQGYWAYYLRVGS